MNLLQTVENVQNNASQSKIAKTLNISSSTLHNIIKMFRESGGYNPHMNTFIVHEHSSPYHPKIQVKAPSCDKKE